MILEELLEKLSIKVIALEKLLEASGALQEGDISRAEEEIKRQLSNNTGERIRQLNSPGKLHELCAREEKK